MKNPPAYGVTSVDHALRLAVILQVEGPLTVSTAAERLGVAKSTAHRLLTTLVYRDFAVQDDDRSYHAGPVLELAATAHSRTGAIRAAALGPMQTLVDTVDETVNLSIRTGRTIRFIASVESRQTLRVSSREGMVLPAHQSTGGLVMLAALTDDQITTLYDAAPPGERIDLSKLRAELKAVRRSGIAINLERTERGLIAMGHGITDAAGSTVAAVSVSMPSVRYSTARIRRITPALTAAANAISTALV
ncbi:IclR family transcriptional regulator [Kribbella sp. VKM Ac-2569]|uniref:IclR family transcriptional regulator n=1 Tax=Kribbella sp. VKM Ac-2569 TaxID=2512220 RepID=UPI00102BF979|nr:IclR family transcriptional regulator [Kribbella sp. VKM Ac-2569]RZT11710.1 IclR family transcriptional regulator [Kribbella sp. VKM Ac-2569]